MTKTPVKDDPVTALRPEVLLDLHRRMVRIRLFEEEAGQAHGGRPDAGLPAPLRRPGGGRRRRRWRRCATTTRSPRPTAATGTPSPRAPTSGRCSPSCSARSTGYCNGRGGSMHINDLTHRHARRQRHRRRPASRIAVGAAFASGYRGDGSVAVAFFGDGAPQHRRVPRGRQHGRGAASCRSSSSARTTATPSSPRRPRTCCSTTSPTGPPPTACPA